MQESRRSRSRWKSALASVLLLLSLASGVLGFATEATYSVAVVGSFFWLGTGILGALLAIALLMLEGRV